MTTIAAPRPAATEPNPRATIGGNMPPLEESILMDFDSALRDREGLLARIDAMEAKADAVTPCDNDETAGRMGDFIKMTAAAAKAVEEEREKLNRPLLTAQRALKGRADHYVGRAQAAGVKVRAHLDAYLADKERKRRAEEARLAEIERQAEAERQRVLREAEAEARRVAEAERQRLQAIEDERAAAEAREAKAVEVEVAPVFVPEPEPVFNTAAPEKAPLRGDYGTAVSTVETWHVEVQNVRQVPDAYLKHPTVIEALEKVIRPMVRGKNGLREIKGCRIYSTLGSSVR
jgi:cell division septum initiation protein DivIVA